MSKELTSPLADAGIYILMEDVTNSSCKNIISFILEKNIEMTNKSQIATNSGSVAELI
ncbi:MAG TPA: hypothetical protein VMX17_07005 [Candidatus Glassbacteria bacterium]|nr:hypothetical protein [Candidatus Glassbacteria bacterium]